MTPDEQSATYASRHAAHLKAMLGEASAEAIDGRAKIETLAAHAADLEQQLVERTTQRDEALHMQAETMKTVEQSGSVIEELKAEMLAQGTAAAVRYERLMAEHVEFFNRVQREAREKRNAARRKPKT